MEQFTPDICAIQFIITKTAEKWNGFEVITNQHCLAFTVPAGKHVW